jgi:anti-anti-sigma factor
MAELGPSDSKATCSISHEDGIPVLRLGGELDVSSLHHVRPTADELIAQHPEQVILDLTELTFMDSSGITLFLWIAHRVGSIELRNASPIVRNLLELTGLTATLPIRE